MSGPQWPVPAGRAQRSLAVVPETAASSAAKHQAEAERLALEAFGEMMGTLDVLIGQAAACADLKALPAGLSRLAEEIRDHSQSRAEIAQRIASNLRR